MAFNIGLSGLRAASTDLDVTGNNIANASTVGFKGSRAQFGDLYANGFLSSGSNTVGDGVRVQNIKQSFGQGNISFTDNGLDMAINGDGFFVMNNGGEVSYSRAGQFGVNKDGYVVNNQGARVQGFQADSEGNVSGVRDDLFINRDNLAPRRTTGVESELNLDAREGVLAKRVDLTNTVGLETGEQYGEQKFTLEYSDKTTRVFPLEAGSSAKAIANRLSQEEGVSASARTNVELNGSSVAAGDTLNLNLPGQVNQPIGFEIQEKDEAGKTLSAKEQIADLADRINSSSLGDKLNATITDINDTTGKGLGLRVIANSGETIELSYENTGTGKMSFITRDDDGTAAPPDAGGADNVGDENNADTQVGLVNVTLNRGLKLSAELTGSATGKAISLNDPVAKNTNEFNPSDQRTYNHATSNTVYDSLGNPHVMTQYFVKEPATGVNQGSPWSLYVQVDGKNVGDPPSTDGEPSRASYNLLFNDNGRLESVNGEPDGEILVSNWSPTDPNGKPNGADGPRLVGDGGETPIPDPPISSNFTINLNETTQFGSAFAVNDKQQDGYSTGRLSGLDVSNEGVLFARYTNGQSQTLGQVALANFNNTNGLAPIGDTGWVETFDSGQPVIGKPNSGSLGSIAASSIEESNVDLSQELVNLIIAQRNYQANAKTIETANSVTQTIINLR